MNRKPGHKVRDHEPIEPNPPRRTNPMATWIDCASRAAGDPDRADFPERT
jgi:hypothetical protein